MKKHLILFSFMLFTAVISGCNRTSNVDGEERTDVMKQTQSNLLGVWVDDSGIGGLVFFDDGTWAQFNNLVSANNISTMGPIQEAKSYCVMGNILRLGEKVYDIELLDDKLTVYYYYVPNVIEKGFVRTENYTRCEDSLVSFWERFE